jgi:hypothetical protein
MQMRDSDILFFHELFDNLKTYVDKQADLEEATDQLIDLFDDHGYDMEESVLGLRGYSKTIDYCIEAKYDIDDEETEEDVFDSTY